MVLVEEVVVQVTLVVEVVQEQLIKGEQVEMVMVETFKMVQVEAEELLM